LEESEGLLYLGEFKGQKYFSLWPAYDPHEQGSELLGFLATFFKKSLDHIQRFKELKRAKTLMYQDDVTGLFNQRKLLQDLDTFIHDPLYKGMKFAILFIDIDHFKKVNDGHGHLVGTELLQRFAGLLKTGLRDGDICYRYGGDEFVVILPSIDTNQASIVAQRLLNEIKRADFTIMREQTPMRVSASIGVAGYPDDAKGRDEVLQMADEMMYHAKSRGRGQVFHINLFTGKNQDV
jgi:diguanylate cyclase (GGDEF)-like protein